MEKLLKVSSSPHVRDGVTTQRLMFDVVIAMIPASVYGVWQFGMNALLVLIATVIASVAAEYLYEKLMHKPITISDGSAVVTGMILALNMPPEIPVWIPVLGAFFAIIVVKQLYGGLGQNFMNPALAARCFLLTSFALFMNNFSSAKLGFDSLTSATPLAQLRAGETVDLASLVIGRIPGTIGEVSVIALLIGAIYMVVRKVISPVIPLIYIGTVFVFTFLFGGFNLTYSLSEICAGGLIFGAFFMATDYVTSPLTPKGQIVYGLILGIVTGIFRLWGASPEGVSYAIIFSNLLVPLIERYTLPTAFGKVTINDAKEALDASGNQIGYLITSTSAESYGGNVQIAVGITNEGELTGIGFLSISDTPGLGMRAKEPDFKDQFIGKKAENLEVTKTGASADNQIEAISGATITSKAVTNATDAAIYFVANCLAQ